MAYLLLLPFDMRRGFFAILLVLNALPSAVWAQQPMADLENLFKKLQTFGLPQANDCCAQVEDWRKSLPPILNAGDRVDSDVIMFVTHPSRKWDAQATIQEPLDQSLAAVQLFGARTIYLVHSSSWNNLESYYPQVRPNYLYLSEAGEHKIRTSARIGIFTGGFSDMCAASTLHDFILRGDFSRGPMVAVLPADSIYSPSTRDEREHGLSTQLKKRIENLSDPEFVTFIRSQYFSDGYIGRGYDSAQQLRPKIEDFTIRILRDGKEVGQLGNGKKEILMHFLEKKTLKAFADNSLNSMGNRSVKSVP